MHFRASTQRTLVSLLGAAILPLLIVAAGCGGGGSSGGPSPVSTATPGGPTPTPGPTPTAAPFSVPSVAFVSTRDGNQEIYLAQNNAQVQTRITNSPEVDTHPSLSPDGRNIAFSSLRDGNAEIYLFSLDGPEPRLKRFTSDSGAFAPTDDSPAFSPDGNTIAWVSTRGGNSNVWLMDATGANQRQLTTLTGVTTRDPAWAPNGARLAFVTSNASGSTIQLVDINTKVVTPTQATTSSDIFSPSFNGAGTKIVFSTTPRRAGGAGISILDLTNSAVTAGPGADLASSSDPSWSRSTDLIAYKATSGATSQIFVSPSSGAASRQITTQGENFLPSF